MVLDLEKYALREGVTPLSAEELNARFYALVRRIHELETLRMDWLAAVAQVRDHGLARINDAVKPLLDGLRADMEAVIALGESAQADFAAQGQAALAAQAASAGAALAAHASSVAAMLASMETRIAQADALLSGLGASLNGVLLVSGQLVKETVQDAGVTKVRLSVAVPPPAEVPLTDPAQLECLLW